jgi:5'-nucleotidase
MHRVRRVVAGLAGMGTVVAAAVTGAGVAQAATNVGTGALDPSLTAVNILNINDFHGRIDTNSTGALGLSFACTLETTKASLGEASTVFLSAGDNIGATPFTSSSQRDEPTIEYLDALQLAASSVGNHEFDQGFGDLTGRVDGLADFPYLGANVYERGTTTPALPEYTVRTVNGLRVGVIGAVTQETPSLVSPTGVSGLDFGDPVAAVNRVADRLTDGDEANGEADVLVAEYHEGASDGAPEGATLAQEVAAGGPFADIVTKTSAKVAAIFTGHTHKEYAWDAPVPGGTGTRPILQAASYASRLGQVSLGFDPATKRLEQYSVRNIAVPTSAPAAGAPCTADPQYVAAKSIVDTAVAQAKVVGGRVVGRVTGDITTAFTGATRDDRTRESSLGDLSAQIWLDALNAPSRSGADIGVQNPGGLRADLYYAPSGSEAPGEVTYAEAASVNPFANTLQTVDLTGAQVVAMLEQQWQPAGAQRSYLALGLSRNVTYTYDPSRPQGSRITSVVVDAAPLDVAATYTVATNSFLAAGGDNFTVFREGTNRKDSGLIDTDAFVNHFLANSPVSPDFTAHGVAVVPTPTAVNYGKTTTFRLEGFDLTSLGAPANTSARVYLDGRFVQTVPITTTTVPAPPPPARTGVATVSFKLTGRILPDDRPRTVLLTVVASPSGTTVSIPVRVKG